MILYVVQLPPEVLSEEELLVTCCSLLIKGQLLHFGPCVVPFAVSRQGTVFPRGGPTPSVTRSFLQNRRAPRFLAFLGMTDMLNALLLLASILSLWQDNFSFTLRAKLLASLNPGP